MAESWSRTEIAHCISARLRRDLAAIREMYRRNTPSYVVVDDLLPEAMAAGIGEAFPDPGGLMLRHSLRELKYVTSQMNRCAPLLEEAVFAFQDKDVIDTIAEITGLAQLEADERLYAGGISIMARKHFLNPHIDNSHDKDRTRYRVLNLLYYVSSGWRAQDGGSFELWPDGPRAQPITIPSLFNRLVVMATTRSSWHSVNRVVTAGLRKCVSNYYFSPLSPESEEYFHVTSFRGRPEQRLRDLVLRSDAALRALLRRVRRTGLVETKHYYR